MSPRAGRDLDVPSELADETVDERESQPTRSAVAGTLGRVAVLEDPFGQFR